VHELSIAIALVDLACEQSAQMDGARIEGLHVRVGPLSGVAADALRFSFDLAAAGTAVEGARLLLEDAPLVVYCGRCRADRTLAGIQSLRCPECRSPTPEIKSGRELQLIALEVADHAATHC
jgi:hydrogenase nickel incorporation protein HypA/HybF